MLLNKSITLGKKIYIPVDAAVKADTTTAAAAVSLAIIARELNLLVYKSTVSSIAELINSATITIIIIRATSNHSTYDILNIIPNNTTNTDAIM